MCMHKADWIHYLLNNRSLSLGQYLTPPFVRAVAAVSGSKAEALGAAFSISGVQMERSQFALVTARAFHIFLRVTTRHWFNRDDEDVSRENWYINSFTNNMRGAEGEEEPPCINSVRWRSHTHLSQFLPRCSHMVCSWGIHRNLGHICHTDGQQCCSCTCGESNVLWHGANSMKYVEVPANTLGWWDACSSYSLVWNVTMSCGIPQN